MLERRLADQNVPKRRVASSASDCRSVVSMERAAPSGPGRSGVDGTPGFLPVRLRDADVGA